MMEPALGQKIALLHVISRETAGQISPLDRKLDGP